MTDTASSLTHATDSPVAAPSRSPDSGLRVRSAAGTSGSRPAPSAPIAFRDGERVPSAPPQPLPQPPGPAANAASAGAPRPPLLVALPPPRAFTPEVSPALCRLVERQVLEPLVPSLASLRRRREQLQRLSQHVAGAVWASAAEGHAYGDVRVYIFGSVNMRTVLPDGDNDITLEVDGLLPPSAAAEAEAAANAAAAASPSPPPARGYTVPLTTDSNYNNCEGTLQLVSDVDGRPFLASPTAINIASGTLLSGVRDWLTRGEAHPVTVDSVISAEVRVLKLVMEGGSYDVTVNQFGGVNCVRFLHEMDAAIGGDHLLKRTLLLLKSWCSYEAHVLGGQAGYIGSYAATVMLISMINTTEFLEDVRADAEEEEGEGEEGGVLDGLSPLVLLARFIKFYHYFDFANYCVTAFGPLRLSDISAAPYDLSRLEVPAAHPDPPPPGTPPGVNRWGTDTNELGLTAEGRAAVGGLVRRRARPLLTVSGVRHLLDTQAAARLRERERRYARRRQQQQREAAGGEGGGEGAEDAEEEPGDGEYEGFPPLRLGRAGSSEADAALVCPSCTTALFPVRVMNVLDPLRWSSNMVRGVSRNHLQRIGAAFAEGTRLLGLASARLPPPPPPPAGAAPAPGCSPPEAEVLRALFGGTLATLARARGGAPEAPVPTPAERAAVLAAPSIPRMCQPACVLDAPGRTASPAEQRRRRLQGPLGEAQVPDALPQGGSR